VVLDKCALGSYYHFVSERPFGQFDEELVSRFGMTQQETTQRPMGRLERRKARTRAAILQAAAQLFRERGFAKTSIVDIADTADVGVGTLYGYFNSKYELLQEVLRQHALEARERYRASVDESTPAVERVVRTLEEVARYVRENRVLLASAFREEPGDRRPEYPAEWLFEALGQEIKRGIERGELHNVPIDPTVKTLLTVYTAAMLGIGVWHGEDPDKALAELNEMTRAFLAKR